MPFDHCVITVPMSDHAAVVAWYEAALKPLGYTKAFTFGLANGESVGFSNTMAENPDTGYPDWWVTGQSNGEPSKSHYAFAAKDRGLVDAFHKAAVAAGGKDNGAPGVRAQYHANYYAAYVFDPVGNNIEVICRTAQA
ncbi:hypothetical protein PQX77_021340 [Marasmius sp. AFHP31]|nr:hypothetical protein PQX77_021340 [Marasmius sp. AFHP31]